MRSLGAVKYAKTLCKEVEFSPEDATRTDMEFLSAICEAVLHAETPTVNIPDTVGYTIPSEFGGLIRAPQRRVKGIDKATLSVHCNDDLGVAVANSLAAVLNGAKQVECTINGVGERAGDTSLEEVVMALRTRSDLLHFHTRVIPQHIFSTSRLLSKVTGIAVQPNKAIVGANAFASESAIHQNGLLKEKLTYEIMRPESIGIPAVRNRDDHSHHP